MAISVSCRLRRVRVRGRAVERLVRAVLGRLGYAQAEVALTFIGEHAMRVLNRRYRGQDRPTDVLAFAGQEALHPPSAVPVLGDVVVSVPRAIQQARSAGHTVDDELTLLVVHGILHLCGYDHERSEREARRMFRKQRQLLTCMRRPPRFFVGSLSQR